MGIVIIATKNGTEKYPGCTAEASVSEPDERADIPLSLDCGASNEVPAAWGNMACQIRSTGAITSAVSLEVGNSSILLVFSWLVSSVGAVAGGISGGPLRVWPWHQSGRRGASVQEPARVFKTTRTDFHLGVIAKAMALG